MNVNVHPMRRMTPAEEAVIESAATGIEPGETARLKAIDLLRTVGLPHRRIEAWHYTDLRALMARDVVASAARVGDVVLAPLLPGSLVVDLDLSSPLPQVTSAMSIARTGETPDYREIVNHLDRDVDTIRLVNAAFGSGATRISVADGSRLDQPVELRPEAGAGNGRSFAIVEIGDKAAATFVERLSPGGASSLSSAVSTLTIGHGSEVLWIIDQEKGTGETHLGQLNVEIGTEATFRLFVLNAGGALVRLEVHAVTTGEGADIQMRGVNLIRAGQHIDVTTTLNHTVANTTSTETFRNVVMGGHGVFQGMIKVSKGAQKTDARMACNTLLLSDNGDFSAKPELEIFADDVQCGHGATAGEIDTNHLFYLMSRGIPAPEARALLVKAFVAEVVEDIPHPGAVEALEARIDAWLAKTSAQ